MGFTHWLYLVAMAGTWKKKDGNEQVMDLNLWENSATAKTPVITIKTKQR